jgi:hypothetical protein
MALLSFRGISTPSLLAQGEQRRSSYFNIRRGNPLVRTRMVKRAHGAAGVPGAPMTVRAICEAYLEYMESHKKTAADSKYRLEALVYPNLGDIDAETLTAEVVRKWLAHLAASAPRVRTKAGAKQQYRDHDSVVTRTKRRRSRAAADRPHRGGGREATQ